VYLQKNGSFGKKKDVEIHLGETMSIVDIVDIDSDGTDELCGFDDDGMVVYQLNEEFSAEQSRMLECRTLLPPSSRRMASVNWIADIDADGQPDLVVPVTDGIRVFVKRNNAGFVELDTFAVPVRGSLSGNDGQDYVTYRLPIIDFNDYDKDGHTDIGAFDMEQINFFLSDGSRTPRRHISAPLLQKFTKDFIASTEFQDINADGVPDAVMVLMSQKKNLESEVRIYFGNADFSYGEHAAHVYSGDTNLILPVFLDATGDGKMEMLLQSVDVGFSFFLNYFLANRIKVDTGLYRLSSGKNYGKEPIAERTVYIGASESGTEPARGVGDFNGDGLDDLAVGTDENSLSFFLSGRKAILSDGPGFELELPAYGTMKTFLLNEDDRTDMIIIYPQEEDAGATLLLSN
jgi:hypothetical protein